MWLVWTGRSHTHRRGEQARGEGAAPTAFLPASPWAVAHGSSTNYSSPLLSFASVPPFQLPVVNSSLTIIKWKILGISNS